MTSFNQEVILFIYLIVNHVTGRYYVGQHKGTNLKKYLHQKLSHARRGEASGSILYRSMRKHGPAAFSIHALMPDIQTRTELDQREKEFIGFLQCRNRDYGYNICRGGEGFTGIFSPESRAKMSAAQKRIWTDPELRKNHEAAAQARIGIPRPPHIGATVRRMRTGVKASDQTKEKIRQARLSQPDPRLGTHHSEETKQRISTAKKGQISWMKNQHHTSEANEKNRQAHVIDIRGQQFGGVIPVALVETRYSQAYWSVRCAICKAEGVVRSGRIRNGDSAFMKAHRH